MIVVPDASVLLKWVLEKEEPASYQQALNLQAAFLAEEVELRVPTLWRYEVGNVLGLKQPRLAGDLMKALLAFEFEEVPLQQEFTLEVLTHMQEVPGVTFYDSAYHVLALRVEGVYVTADAAYVKRAKRKGHVTLLSEWAKA
ncbi:MAG: type II toxin-antitoxin system VapC family toxin [Nitrospirales bacterium]